jgi:hypothetical protein
MRLRADIWVSAYLRQRAAENVPAVLRRRGAPEAGAIFVKIDRLDGHAAIYGPAPQTETAARGVDRLWMRLHRDEWIDSATAEERLRKEINFDPDLWIVEAEDRLGRHGLDLADDA